MDGRARIVVSDNISLDGVIEDPAGDEGFARGGWVGLISNRPDLGQGHARTMPGTPGRC
jgi:hypothetical protein